MQVIELITRTIFSFRPDRPEEDWIEAYELLVKAQESRHLVQYIKFH